MIALLLGHKDLRMATRAHHLLSTFLSDAVNKLDFVFGQLKDSGKEFQLGVHLSESILASPGPSGQAP
jgi:hypothetical protein